MQLAHVVCKVPRLTAVRDCADVYPGLLNSVLGAVRNMPAISATSHLPLRCPRKSCDGRFCGDEEEQTTTMLGVSGECAAGGERTISKRLAARPGERECVNIELSARRTQEVQLT